jgi:hypothetical protein
MLKKNMTVVGTEGDRTNILRIITLLLRAMVTTRTMV